MGMGWMAKGRLCWFQNWASDEPKRCRGPIIMTRNDRPKRMTKSKPRLVSTNPTRRVCRRRTSALRNFDLDEGRKGDPS